MACVNDKGQLSESAKKLLRSIETQPLSPQEISKMVGTPLFKVRSSLREMKGFKLIEEENSLYRTTTKGLELLEKS